jgi:hypothetical protein
MLKQLTSAQITEWFAYLRMENDELLVDRMNTEAVQKLAARRYSRG